METAQHLRSFLKILEKHGQLISISQEVDPCYELAGIMFKAAEKGAPALLFENVRGKSISLVANLCASRQRLALALDTSEEAVSELYRQRMQRLIPSETIREGSCQEVVKDQPDLDMLPVITAHEYDAGPYITAGVVVAKHPKSGIPNLSLHRIFPLGRDRAAIYINPGSDLAQYYKDAGQEPLPVAVILGLHPAFLMAAAVRFPMNVDEYQAAGSLLDQPAQLVRCKTIDIEVPANAEIILEGRIPQGLRVLEGPFGEYPGTYGAGHLEPQEAPVIEFEAMTFRREPIYQAFICGPTLGHESTYLHSVAREGAVFAAAKGVCPAVKAVAIMPCRYWVAIQVEGTRHPGDVGLIMAAAFSANDLFKYVVVVDEDVNIADPSDVFWAMATRVDPGQDIYFFPRIRMDALDPATDRVCAKVGIDATISLNADRRGFTRTRILGLDKIRIEDYWKPSAFKST